MPLGGRMPSSCHGGSKVVHGMMRSDRSTFFTFFAGVMLVQGVHVIEHIIQLVQVFILHVPEDDALGLLGYVYQFKGTEEFLHLGFNATYLLALLLLIVPLKRRTPQPVPVRGFVTFVVGAVGLESWHMVEHTVIITHALQNNGCPCPGILDAATGIPDTVLHFFYNAITYAAVAVPFWFVIKNEAHPRNVARRAEPAPLPVHRTRHG
jgi:hypothetical protein